MHKIVPLELAAVEELPHHSRVCAFWETELEPGHIIRGYDDSFEKEAWISNVLLQWGVCGQVLHIDRRAEGTVLYSPPQYSPRQKLMPAGPISPDAVLLSHVYLTDEHRSMMNFITLVNAAIKDLRDRGVRAVEAFGRHGEVGVNTAHTPDEPCYSHECIATDDVLAACGFKEIVHDPRVSRWRLDVDQRNLWASSVKAALDRRYEDKRIELLMYQAERKLQHA